MKAHVTISFSFVAATFLTLHAFPAAAQRVPIHGLTGTIALQGNVDKIYDGANKVVVKAIDGTSHVLNVTKDTQVHGRSEALASLQKGMPVVVHYTMHGTEESADEIDQLGAGGLKNTEGTVVSVDRVHKTITIKYASGNTEALRLTHHAAADGAETVKGNRVIVYYADGSGQQQKVAHYFKRKS